MFYQTNDGYLVVPNVCKVDNIKDLVTAINGGTVERRPIQVRSLSSVPSREFPDEVSRIERLSYIEKDTPINVAYLPFIDVDPNSTIPMDFRVTLMSGRSLEGYLIEDGKAILLKQK